MKRVVVWSALVAALAVTVPCVAHDGYVPAPENLKAREWFQDARFGLFIHWGVYALPGEGDQATVDVGAHLLWLDTASAPGQSWAGFRFIAVPEAHAQRMRQWIDAPGSHYE